MAAYATYRHVELDRVGLGKRRVLKPPGGGSSIIFDEDAHPGKGKMTPPAPQSPTQDTALLQQPEAPKPETNGTTSSPSEPKTTTSPPSSLQTVNGLSTNGVSMNGSSSNGSGVNGVTTGNSSSTSMTDTSFPSVNASDSTATSSSTSHGSESQGTPNSRSTPSTPSTPSSAKQLDTKNRLFGADPVTTPARRIRDHHRSNIFTPAAADSPPTNGTPKPAPPAVVNEGVAESRAPDQPKQQRQRVPPGGFSTQLW